MRRLGLLWQVLILLAAAAVSTLLGVWDVYGSGKKHAHGHFYALLHELVEPGVILVILVLNACVGVFQESSAEAAIEALKQLEPIHATVRRRWPHHDGHETHEERELPGMPVDQPTCCRAPAAACNRACCSRRTRAGRHRSAAHGRLRACRLPRAARLYQVVQDGPGAPSFPLYAQFCCSCRL